jgi:hypothetical protein
MTDTDRCVHSVYRSLLVLVLLLAAFVVVRGYRFSVSDQNEYLPQLHRMLDPEYLRNDWFTNETAPFNPRTCFIALVAGVTRLTGEAAAHLLLYAVLFGALCLGVIRLGECLLGSRTAGVFGAALVLFGPVVTLGGQDLLSNYLQQSMVGATGIVWALAMFFERRWPLAWLLAGLATVFHVTTGLIGAVLLGALTLVRIRGIGAKKLALSAAAFLVPALAAGVPLLIALRAQGAGLSDAAFIDVLGRVRAPWHYLPSRFPAGTYVEEGLLLVTAAAAWLMLPPSPHRRAVYALVGTLAALCVAAYVFVELVPMAAVMSLDLMRATVYFRLLAMLALGGAVHAGLRRREAAQILPAVAIALGLAAHADIVVVVVVLAWLVAQRVPWLARGVAALSALLVAAAICLAFVIILRPSWGQVIVGALHGDYIRLGVGLLLAAAALGLFALWLHGGAPWQRRMRRLAPVLWLVPAAVIVLEVFDGPLQRRFPGIHELTVARLEPGRVYAGDLDEMAAWCRDNTPADAVFIIPPGGEERALEDFRLKAGRAIVADFKAIPFARDGLREWRERIRDLTNDVVFPSSGYRKKELRTGYASLTAEDFSALAAKYGASFILVEKPKELPFALVHETGGFRLYAAE